MEIHFTFFFMVKKRMDGLPYIIILDWDGTIAGRVDYQSQRHAMHQYFKKFGLKGQQNNKIPKAFLPTQKLIRPGLADFIHEITRYFNNQVLFYVYTASERVWAYKEIQWVEKSHGIKFQRPIFTRDDCKVDIGGNYRKSLQAIFPRIVRSIGRNPPLTKQEKDELFQNRILMIDNNSVYTDHQNKLLLCPDYNYTVFENLMEDIPSAYLKHPNIRSYILSLTNSGLLCPFFPSSDLNHLMFKKYEWLAVKCKQITEANKVYTKDVFFPYLTKLIVRNQLKAFSPNVVKQLQEAVWKRAEKQKH